ncbi:hypothetical protein GGR54DRAFT_600502 [Hypoxylon sp. NC1633]|nr:hypothetical protein GGR54DRAFT_600502 [Hypoxylon sp. NC1633]
MDNRASKRPTKRASTGDLGDIDDIGDTSRRGPVAGRALRTSESGTRPTRRRSRRGSRFQPYPQTSTALFKPDNDNDDDGRPRKRVKRRATRDWGHGPDRDDDEDSSPDYDVDDFNAEDNPLKRPGDNRTTMGLEFEFIMAVARRAGHVPDSHPNDNRWLSERMVGLGNGDPNFSLTVTNQIIDVLRNNGVVAVKIADAFPGLDYTLSLEHDPDYDPNAHLINMWVGNHEWKHDLGRQDAARDCLQQFLNQYSQFHIDNGLQVHQSLASTAEPIAMTKFRNWIVGAPDDEIVQEVCTAFMQILPPLLEERKIEFNEAQSNEVDPNCVMLHGSDTKYFSWSCTEDPSVSAGFIYKRHYHIPPESVPLGPLIMGGPARMELPEPPELYSWHSPELISPILDFNNPNTFPTIQRACAAVRNNFRVHKPMSAYGAGLHVHFGQEAGWTLLHLKKFSALWLILEQTLERLHRIDRSAEDSVYTYNLRIHSNLARAFSEGKPGVLSNLANFDPQKSARYRNARRRHIPPDARAHIPQYMRDMIEQLWQYDTISKLNHGMTSRGSYGSLRYRFTGQKLSNPPSWGSTQTLEVRLMQGTMDADHIRRWATVIERMIIFSRDTTAQQYNQGLQTMVTGAQTPWTVMGVPQVDVEWFGLHNGAKGYFEYPDKDKVNWADPFMVPGYADTHRPHA